MRRNWFRFEPLLATAVLALLAACGQTPPQGDPPPDPAIALSLETSRAEVMRGGSHEVAVTLTRVGAATQPVVLGLGGDVPPGVSMTFDPEELTGDLLVSTLTIATDSSAASATFALQVTADVTTDVGELSASQPLDVVISGLDVTGRVEDPEGRPLPGVRVRSGALETVADGQGSFTFEDLTVPYDLVVGSQPAGWIHVFEGLRNAQPVLVPAIRTDEVVGRHATTVTGKLGDGVPVLTNEVVIVCVEGLKGIASCSSTEQGDETYVHTVTWEGDSRQEVTLHGLYVEVDGDGGTRAFTGYDSVVTELEAGTPYTWHPARTRVSTAFLEVDADPGTGIDEGTPLLAVAWRISKHLSVRVDGVEGRYDASMAVPYVRGLPGTFDVFVADGYEGPDMAAAWRPNVTLRSDASFRLPDLPVLSMAAPISGDVGFDTEFTVSGLDGRYATYMWRRTSDSETVLALTTTRATVTMPNPVALGFDELVADSTELQWVVASSLAADPDDATRDAKHAYDVFWAVRGFGRPLPEQAAMVSVQGPEFTFGTPIP